MRFSIHFTDTEFLRLSQLNVPENPLLTISRGIASSPLLSLMPDVNVYFCRAPPEIFFVGNFSPADIVRFKMLTWQLKHALRTLRYVDYACLERDCLLLAHQLKEKLGPDQICRYFFSCIPRGGFIVLGILSYLLKLERWQLNHPQDSDVPVVVVDDCALTGSRFFEFLQKNPCQTVIFAPVYSLPELRSAIEKKEQRVKACISAHDLENHWHFPVNDVQADQELNRWAFLDFFDVYLDKSQYGNSLTEYLCFAWNEPEFPFINPVTKEMEGYWTIFPHDVCLRNGPVRIPVHARPDIKTEFRVSEDIVAISDDNSVTIDNTATHNRFMMRGIAAEMWNVLMDQGTQEALFSTFSREYDVDETTLRRDIADFIRDLVSRGILKTAAR